jgi:hypothetical protein
VARTLIRRIVSGGQTGVDRAGLDVAIRYGIEYGGWVPQGGIAEDMRTPPGLLAHYPRLQEAPTTSMSARTKMNIRDSDATLVIRIPNGPLSPGTKLTIDSCRETGKPVLVVDPLEWDGADQIAEFIHLLDIEPPIVLNVAGPRESKSRGIYDAASSLLIEYLSLD